jgi:hypothetical protein
MKISPEQIQEETNAYYGSQNAKHWQEISNQLRSPISALFSVFKWFLNLICKKHERAN